MKKSKSRQQPLRSGTLWRDLEKQLMHKPTIVVFDKKVWNCFFCCCCCCFVLEKRFFFVVVVLGFHRGEYLSNDISDYALFFFYQKKVVLSLVYCYAFLKIRLGNGGHSLTFPQYRLSIASCWWKVIDEWHCVCTWHGLGRWWSLLASTPVYPFNVQLIRADWLQVRRFLNLTGGSAKQSCILPGLCARAGEGGGGRCAGLIYRAVLVVEVRICVKLYEFHVFGMIGFCLFPNLFCWWVCDKVALTMIVSFQFDKINK